MWLVLFMTLAHWAGYELLACSPRQRRILNVAGCDPPYHRTRWWLVFYLSLAFGFLAKGPIAWIPLLTVGATIFHDTRLAVVPEFQIPAWNFADARSCCTLGNPSADSNSRRILRDRNRTACHWPLARHDGRSRGEFVWDVSAAFAVLFRDDLRQFLSLVDQVAVVDPAIVEPKEDRDRDPGDRGHKIDNYLLTGIAIIFVIFTLVSTKLPHYTLPAFPLLALLLARHWQGASTVRNHGSSFRTIATSAACVWVAIALVVPPLVARFFPAYQLFRESRAYLQTNMQFASVEFEEPSVVWYFRSRVQGFLTRLNKKNAVDFMSKPGPRFVIVPTPLAETLFPNRPQDWKMFSTRGFNIA